jgi:2-phospho-L-lactate guanylyltransferase
VLVVTPDPNLAPVGTEVLRDRGRGHAKAIAEALADPRSAAGAVIVMADCPLVRPETIDLLVAAARPVALCPAQDGGTNALALIPGDTFEPVFGVPGGAAANAQRARLRGFRVEVIDDPLAALDLDSPDDARRLLELGHSTRTHAFLDQALAASAEFCGTG